MSELPKLEYQRDDFSPKPKLNALGTPTPPSPEPPREREGDGIALLKRRDDAWEYFESHPDSYGAMADWEMADDALRAFIAAASLPPSAGTINSSRTDSTLIDVPPSAGSGETEESSDDL